ncbi:multidrug effflux MFS transporter [Colwellia echini]|uniref:Bcr/CflA family efflux transporter n=1 Tax=Colwellia echini TaxID=1982103 RepID=A0ABY3MVU6_9GAMM|nr:multidrug effflux MFS transporter [Colwellia echini]TYK65229.1 multidrug effflux MFS transporter [Colwellia echini]
MKVEQPLLGKIGTLIFLVMISAFPPLTTDIYLAALPTMVNTLNTNETMVNLTLSLYFLVYAITLLFWGPLSEKFGRKPILLFGLGIYVTASVLCALSNSVEMLIAARLIQAFGGSAITVVATAIVKDLYDGRQREKIMAIIMSLVIIAPMVAPILGAFLLKISSWHMMFIALAIFGGIATVFSLLFKETLAQKYSGSVLHSWGRLGVVIKNKQFLSLLAIFAIPPMALMSFLAAGSFIYINDFGLSEQMFSYAFSFNAFFAAFGPSIYIALSKRIAVDKIITACFVILTICGTLTYTLGNLSPLIFALITAPVTIMIIMVRVPGINLMLNQQENDTGSSVAIIQFCSMMAGSLGMMLVMLRPQTLIQNLGIIQFCIGAIACSLWLLVRSKPYVSDNLAKLKE